MTAPTKPRPPRTAATPPQPAPAPRKIVSMVRTPVPTARPQVRGKFLFVDDEKFIIKGVTYGPFKPEADGSEYHTIDRVRRDFDAMSMAGLNTVRVYTVPPRWLLDVAMEYGLRVMVGLPWEQHITFLDEPERARDIERRVRDGVLACKQHPAVLCYAIGNEIPSPIVRWHGAAAVENFLGTLYHAAKDEDPEALVVYVNYPTTEYLRAPTDFVCFNVYLETPEKLANYLARLHSLAGDRPLVMAEVGLDSQRNGEARQAEVMRWQVETAFVEGCAGLFAFAWSDEWYRGGADILDWSFGLVDREGKPKEALAAVARAFSRVPVPAGIALPRISVIICTYNGSRTIRECLEGVTKLRYPNYEVLVIDDGSKDNAAEIAASFSTVRLIRTLNQGLSAARNLGAREATGEIVAYIDDDATPDPDWLTYLALTYATNDFVAVGGPNIPPPGDGFIAECVARAPGGPMHVMLTDRVAEHIPGCNMSFLRERLLEIGGFDTQFRIAGDDVDVCWRLQERGWQLGFSPSAVVWHHRRNSVKTYLKQQRGYGRAEAMLERKWPQKYNAAGHVAWGGKIYAPFLTHFARRVGHIYHGTFGTALFQSVYEPAPSTLGIALMVPEWYLLLLVLAFLSALGLAWPVLLAAVPMLALGVGASVLHACMKAREVTIAWNGVPAWRRVQRFCLTAMLHLLQPIARLLGRLRGGLSPWRWSHGWTVPVSRVISTWSESWQHQVQRTEVVEQRLKERRAVTLRGGDFDPWDLEIKGGVLGGARLQMAIEEHGGGRQQIRVRVQPRFGLLPVAFMGALVVLGVKAVGAGEMLVAIALAVGAFAILLRQLYESGGAVALAAWSIREQ